MDNSFQKHKNEFSEFYKKFGEIKKKDELDEIKLNPIITKYATKMQTDSMYKYIKLNDVTLLDVGCGYGFDLRRIFDKDLNTKLYGVDISPDVLIQTKMNVPGANISLSFAELLPFKNNFFDVIISHEVLEHVVDKVIMSARNVKISEKKRNNRVVNSQR